MADTFDDVLSSVRGHRARMTKAGSQAWYRGLSRDQYKLWSTAHRVINQINDECNGNMTSQQMMDFLKQEEKKIFTSFRSQASPFLDQLQRSDWGLVFAMQHYGLPSRLLDWTESFACALYFACADWDGETSAAICLLNPKELNKKSIDVNASVVLDCHVRDGDVPVHNLHPGIMAPIPVLPSVAAEPVYTNPRMVVQQSRFVLCGDVFEPLEEQFPNAIERHVLTPGMSSDIKRFLSLVGMDWASYFPDMEGLARQYRGRSSEFLQRIRDLREELET